MALQINYDETYDVRGWLDATQTASGWFDGDLSESSGGAPSIQTLTIDGNGTTVSGWVAEGGDYTRIQSDDGDTTRLYTPTNNDVRQFSLTDTSGLSGVTIDSVTVYFKFRSLDPISNTFQIGVRTGSTDYWSSNKDTNPVTTYVLFSETWTTNPNTGIAWTVSDLDALEIGVKKTSAAGGAITYGYVDVEYTDAAPTDLTVNDGTLGATVDNVSLTQSHVLAVADMASSTTVDNTVLRLPASNLVDDYNDNSIDTGLWNIFGSSNVAETGGTFQITNTAFSSYIPVLSIPNYDLTSSYFYIELTDAGDQASVSRGTFFFVELDSNNQFGIRVDNGSISAYVKIGGSETSYGTTAYVPATHACFRLIADATDIFIQTSSDGSSWSTLRTQAIPFAITQVKAGKMVGNWQAETPDVSIFDNFNVLSNDTLLTVADASLAVTLDAPTLTQAHTIAVADATSAITLDNVVLTQAHTLAVADLAISTTVDNAVLITDTALTVADATSGATVDNLALTQAHTLAVQDATAGASVDNVALTQAHTLSVADLAVSTTSDNAVLTNDTALFVADATVSTTVDNLTLTQAHTLSVADVSSATTVEGVTLTQAHSLAVADSALSTTTENVTLTGLGAVLVVDDLAVATTADNLALVQAHTLALADMSATTTIDGVAITQDVTLTVADMAVATTVEAVALAQASTLTVADVLMSLTVDELALTQVHNLTVSDSRLATRSDRLQTYNASFTPQNESNGTISVGDGASGAIWNPRDESAGSISVGGSGSDAVWTPGANN